MKKKTANIVLLLIFMVIGVGYIITATKLQAGNNSHTIGAGYFPLGLGALLEILCAIRVFQYLKDSDASKLTIKNIGLLAILIATTGIFFVVWKVFRLFYVTVAVFAMFLFTIVSPRETRIKRIPLNLILPAAFVGLLYLIFGYVLKLHL